MPFIRETHFIAFVARVVDDLYGDTNFSSIYRRDCEKSAVIARRTSEPNRRIARPRINQLLTKTADS